MIRAGRAGAPGGPPPCPVYEMGYVAGDEVDISALAVADVLVKFNDVRDELQFGIPVRPLLVTATLDQAVRGKEPL